MFWKYSSQSMKRLLTNSESYDYWWKQKYYPSHWRADSRAFGLELWCCMSLRHGPWMCRWQNTTALREKWGFVEIKGNVQEGRLRRYGLLMHMNKGSCIGKCVSHNADWAIFILIIDSRQTVFCGEPRMPEVFHLRRTKHYIMKRMFFSFFRYSVRQLFDVHSLRRIIETSSSFFCFRISTSYNCFTQSHRYITHTPHTCVHM